LKFTAEDFQRQYADMSDPELLSLEWRELNDVARQCYGREMARRGLKPESEPAAPAVQPEPEAQPDLEPAAAIPGIEPVPEGETAEEEELAPAAICTSREEAAAARALLQESGIPTFLENETLAQDWLPSEAGGALRVLVPASYLGQAREVLRETPG